MDSSPNPPLSRSQPPGGPGRFAYIDALRGLAAVYVVLFHLALFPASKPPPPGWAVPLVLHGGSGVTLFFVVSAFTLCHTMQARRGTPRAGLKFYVRRIARIVPLYYAWLLVTVVLLWDVASAREREGPFALYLTFTFNLVPQWRGGLVWASWTLGVEMLFYLVFPALFRVVDTVTRAAAFLLVAVVVAVVHDAVSGPRLPRDLNREMVLHLGLLHQLPVFAVGMLAYFVHDRFSRWAGPRTTVGAALLGAGGVMFAALAWTGQNPFTATALYLDAANYALILLGLSAVPLRPIVNRATVFLGTISYSTYLGHSALLYYLSGPVYRPVIAMPWPNWLKFTTCAAVTLLLLVPASYLTYRLIERPGIWLGDRFIRRLGGPPEPAEPRAVSAATAPAP